MAREKWASRSAFIFASIGSAIGLGNVWRFPGQAAKYGGGTFLIAYLIALVAVGFPLLMTELTIGRKMQRGAPGTFRGLGKKMEWIGWAGVGTAFVICCYYAAVLAWVLSMIVASFGLSSAESPGTIFMDDILQVSSGPMDFGGVAWGVLIALVIAWLMIYWCIRDGSKSIGKVAKYTVFLPAIFLVLLLINGLTLDGAMDGIQAYLTPEWSEFLNYEVWLGAFGQVFYSMSIMMAIMITYGSFLKKDSNLVRDTAIIAGSDAIVSFISGLVIFSTLGYMAYASGVPFSTENVEAGVGLVFVVYPEVFAALPGGPIVQTAMAILFYLALLTLAVGSAFSIVEAVATAISDKFGLTKKKVTRCVCLVAGIISILFATKAGLYWLDIVDQWANSVDLILVGILECIAIGWVFGAKRVREEFNKTSKLKIGRWYDFIVKFLSPVAFIVMLVLFFINTFQNGYEGYPTPALIYGGWTVSVFVFASGFIIRLIVKRSKRLTELEKKEKSWDEME